MGRRLADYRNSPKVRYYERPVLVSVPIRTLLPVHGKGNEALALVFPIKYVSGDNRRG